jgi:hypothetical protein
MCNLGRMTAALDEIRRLFGTLRGNTIPQAYEGVIQRIADWTGASDSLLHVHAGMAVLLAARLLTGRSLATPIPFAAVCVFEFVNEVMDRMSYGSWHWPDTGMDALNTLFWPFVLMIGLRVRRARAARATRRGR